MSPKKKKKMKVLSTDMGNIGIEVKMKIQKMGSAELELKESQAAL